MKVGARLARWEQFKSDFPHARHPYSKRNWGNDLHSLCSYQGKMKPSLAHHLVDVFSVGGETVLDPFAGAGTIPFEAALAGREAFGIDISLMAVALTNAKLRLQSRQGCENLLSALADHINTAEISAKTLSDTSGVHYNKTIEEYFHPDTYREVLLARDFFMSGIELGSPEWCLVFSSMLHILHGNRPYALSRRSHPITPYAPTGEFVRKSVVKSLRAKVERSLATGRGFSFHEGHCVQADTLGGWTGIPERLDCIITSPPFAGSTRFYMTNWMRFWFAGWGPEQFSTDTKQYVEVKQRSSMGIYDEIFRACAEHLRKDGLAVFHLGTSNKSDMGAALEPIATKHMDVVDLFTETVEHCERHGIRDKGGVTGHQYLVMRRR